MLHLSATTVIEKERERERERRSVCSDMCTQQIEVACIRNYLLISMCVCVCARMCVRVCMVIRVCVNMRV